MLGQIPLEPESPAPLISPPLVAEPVTTPPALPFSPANATVAKKTKKNPTCVATTAERFAAFLIDTSIIIILSAVLTMILSNKLHLSVDQILSGTSFSRFFLGTTTLGLLFFYYLLFESIFLSTPGKWLGGLKIRTPTGKNPSIFTIFFRNLWRPIDYAGFPVFVFGFMESTAMKMRLGDFLSQTIVVRGDYKTAEEFPVVLDGASSVRRVLATIVDLVWLGLFLAAGLLFIPTQYPRLADISLNLLVPVTVLILTIWEALFQVTPGKGIFGMMVYVEGGRFPTASILWLRQLMKPLDLNPLSYLLMAVSIRKQRLGDLITDTFVILIQRKLRHYLSVVLGLALPLGLIFIGWHMPDHFIKKNLGIRILGHSVDPMHPRWKQWIGQGIQIDTVTLGVQGMPDSSENQQFFLPGDTVLIFVDLSQYQRTATTSQVGLGFKVFSPDGELLLQQPEAVRAGSEIATSSQARFETRFTLHPDSPLGRYQIILLAKDRLSGFEAERKIDFQVTK